MRIWKSIVCLILLALSSGQQFLAPKNLLGREQYTNCNLHIYSEERIQKILCNHKKTVEKYNLEDFCTADNL